VSKLILHAHFLITSLIHVAVRDIQHALWWFCKCYSQDNWCYRKDKVCWLPSFNTSLWFFSDIKSIFLNQAFLFLGGSSC